MVDFSVANEKQMIIILLFEQIIFHFPLHFDYKVVKFPHHVGETFCALLLAQLAAQKKNIFFASTISAKSPRPVFGYRIPLLRK